MLRAALVSALAATLPLLALPAANSAPAGRPHVVGSPHVVYLAQVDNEGTYTDSDAAIESAVDRALVTWTVESNGQISSFTRHPGIRTFSETGDCVSGSALWNQATGLYPGVDFGGSTGNHLLVMAPSGCGGGVGTVGGDGMASGGLISFDDNPAKLPDTLMHELGHNFGLSHAHAQICDPTCTDGEYANDYDFMGVSIVHTPPYLPASLSSFERTHLGVAQSCEVPGVGLAPAQRSLTATYDLFGRGTGRGTRGLRVVDPVTGSTYFFDWRNHTGLDQRAYYGSSLADQQHGDYNAGVTVEKLDTSGSYTQLQSFAKPDPADGYRFGHAAGSSFTTGGLTMQVDAAPAGSANDATSQVTVTLTNPSVSSPTTPPVLAGRVVAGGVAGRGATLTARTSAWAPGTCFRYQWQEDGRPIAGARAQTYLTPPAATGHRLSVRVVGQRTGYGAHAATSPAVLAGRFTTTKPVLHGVWRVGSSVRVSVGRWSPTPTFAYHWYVGGRRVVGADGPWLPLTSSMVGRHVVVAVVGTRAGFDAAYARSVRSPVVRAAG